MPVMFASPTSCRYFETISSNLSWPDSMHWARRMVWMRIFFSPFAATSSGGLGFSINDADGLSLTGTFRCNGILAAAEAAMALAAGGGGVTGGNEPVVTLPEAGMTMVSLHDGHSICEP